MSAPVQPGLVVKLRPTGPWRIGPDSGARDAVDLIYHSDSLYSAISGAMRLTGKLDEWLEATARNPAGPAVRLSSLYPFHNEIGFVVPPRSIWPPPASSKVRWKGARFIPLGLVSPLIAGRTLEEDQWEVDAPSQCLVPAGRPGPFRTTMRSAAAVDRLNGNIEPHSTACVEFVAGAGMWAVISFADDEQKARWRGQVEAALRLLADSGLGGERSLGWGRSETPEFIEGSLPEMILPRPAADSRAAEVQEITVPAGETPEPVEASPASETPSAWWLLSLFTPSAGDAVDWKRGNYAVVARGGRVESPARSGDLKKIVNMISEGSVLLAANSVTGSATDVAPDGFAHPVYRAGFALAIPIPWLAAS
jgi:CRISPR type III-A-associated RAMP protein Csm4